MNRAVSVINLLAAIIIVLLGLAFLAMLAPDVYRHFFGQRHVTEVVNVDAADQTVVQTTTLGSADYIDGQLLRTALLSEQVYDQASYSKTSENSIRNLAYLLPGQPVRWLFPGNDQLVLMTLDLRDGNTETAPLFATLFAVVQKDSNGDKRLSASDKIALMASRPDGTALVTLAKGLDDMPTISQSGRNLAASVKDAQGPAVLRIDGNTLKVTETIRIPVAP